MTRLIDADALHKLFGAVTTDLLSKPELSKDFEHMVRAFIMTTEMIEDQPTIDAVPVIRCKDCAHWDSDDGVKGYCNGFNLVYRKYDADYYCATAERKHG